MTNLLTATPDDLRAIAKGLSKQDPDRHWARLASLLGRVEDEGLYEGWGFASARAYAEDELGIPPRDFVTLIELWRMMKKSLNTVTPEGWSGLSKAKALLVRKVLALGGNTAEWVATAAHAKSAGELRKLVDAAMGKADEWVVFRCSMPAELAELVEAALVMALPEALPDEDAPDHSRARDKDARFRCLEIIATDWVQRHAN